MAICSFFVLSSRMHCLSMSDIFCQLAAILSMEVAVQMEICTRRTENPIPSDEDRYRKLVAWMDFCKLQSNLCHDIMNEKVYQLYLNDIKSIKEIHQNG